MEIFNDEWAGSKRRILAPGTSCHYRGFELKGIGLPSTSACPECGTSTEPIRFGRVCPTCHYSLDGLDLKSLAGCPECGSAIKLDEYCWLWSPEAKRLWWAFRLTPPVTLLAAAAAAYFGRVPIAMIFPFSTLLLATFFAARAEARDDVAAGRRTKRLTVLGTAVVAALQWTVASTVLIVIAAMVVGALVWQLG